MSRNMLFLKNPRVCTDAPLPGMLASVAPHRGEQAGLGRNGAPTEGLRKGPVPLCAHSTQGPRVQAHWATSLPACIRARAQSGQRVPSSPV